MLRRFSRYVEKVFDFWALAQDLRDTRRGAHLPTLPVWLSGWLMYVFRLNSLNGIEIELRRPVQLNGIVGPRKPSADTIGRTYAHLELGGPREMLAQIARRLKRNKVLGSHRFQDLVCVAFDGHELFASRHRHCTGCLKRRVQQGAERVTEWYHRIVACHVVGAAVPIPLDVEPVRPGEDEVAAAERLLDRLLQRLPRYFDVVTVDALYAQAPFLRKIDAAGKYIIVVLKDERRELLQDAAGLFATLPPRRIYLGHRECQIWDEEGFRSWEGLDVPLRVVRSFETRQQRRRVKGRWEWVTVQGDWWWATNLPQALASTATVWHFGHGRWDIENHGFNELSSQWGMDHCFKHDPTAILAFLLTMLVAFVLVWCFFERNLKTPRREHGTLISLRLQFYASLNDPQCRSP